MASALTAQLSPTKRAALSLIALRSDGLYPSFLEPFSSHAGRLRMQVAYDSLTLAS